MQSATVKLAKTPAVVEMPVGHVVQLDAPLLDMYVPASQAMHVPADA